MYNSKLLRVHFKYSHNKMCEAAWVIDMLIRLL